MKYICIYKYIQFFWIQVLYKIILFKLFYQSMACFFHFLRWSLLKSRSFYFEVPLSVHSFYGLFFGVIRHFAYPVVKDFLSFLLKTL